MLLDRHFFDLLRWTFGRVERTTEWGAELRETDNNTAGGLPIANCRLPIYPSSAESCVHASAERQARLKIGNRQLAIGNVLPYSGRSVV